VCQASEEDKLLLIHPQVMLPVCLDCHNTDSEKQKVDELLEGLADGFVCGCI
jgi:hypothetical protein